MFFRSRNAKASDNSNPTPTESTPDDGPTMHFVGLHLPQKEATSHLLCVGSTGSGKTTMLRLFMQSVLPQIGDGSGLRALVMDVKGDMLPVLSNFCDRARIQTTNPFDARGVAWNMCRDIKEPRVAVEMCFTLIPRDNSESQPFFSDAARHLMYGVMISYMRSGIDWTFADLLRGLMHPRRLRAILKKHDVTRDLIHRYFQDERLLTSILSTVASKTMALEPIAAAYEYATDSFCIEDWVRQEKILILGNSETSRTAIDSINRCIFKRACDVTLQQTETLSPRTWFIVDELSEAGRLDGLVSVLKRGRSKGLCAALSFQSISGLRDARFYGRYFTDEILGQVGNRFCGRLECHETAEWFSRLLGDQEIDQFTVSHTTTSGANSSNSTTRNQQIVTRRALLPSELMGIPACNLENGLSGYCMVRLANPYYLNLPGEQLFNDDLIPPASPEDVPEFIPRDIEAQYLKRWTPQQAAKFGVIFRPKTQTPPRNHRPVRNPHSSLLEGIDDL